jgi:arylsulfatase A-like enzyme
MHKLYIFPICILLLFASFRAQAQQAQKKGPPNVIVILADDLGWGDIVEKKQRISTPNLNKLAADGIRLTNFHASSSLCSPTRAALMTGRYPHSVGVPDLASPQARGDVPVFGLSHEAVTIPEALKPLGYKSMIAGKWHLGFYKENWPRKHGFDEFWGSLIGTPKFWDVEESYHNEDSVKVDKYFTDWITDKSLDFIQKEKDKPFFLYLAYNAPHYPLEAPAKLVNKYRNKFPEDGLYAIYAAMVERMDYNIGRVMAELDRLGIADNTLIVFTSDNGPSAELPSYGLPGAKISRGPFLGHKFSMYEGGVRVPFIARWPGKIPKGVVRDDMALTMDLLPTVLQAAGSKSVPKDVDGKSIVSLLTNQTYVRNQTLHWENIYNMAVQKGDWKLIYQFWENEPHLYNLAADKFEQHDVAKENPGVVKELMAAHENWVKTKYPNPIPRLKERPLHRIPLK